ncbi:hypothetical protein ACFXP7_09310 [Microbacterium sp. P06]|uniref:hypothetical protein n=1 Tax=Microbacterium sp. P06 TaxID=3366949 RepID=UPI003744BCD5
MRSCAVETCQNPVQNAVSLGRPGDIIEFGVCDDHHLAIEAGEIYSFHPGESRTLQLGDRAIPEVIEYDASWYGGKFPIVKLELGRHGVVTQTVSFQISPNVAKMLARYADDEDETVA